MSELPPCRWRERCCPQAYECHSPKYLAPPNTVTPSFCRTCGYRDHEPLSRPSWAAPVQAPELLCELLPSPGQAAAGSSSAGRGTPPWTELPPIFCITCVQMPERARQAARHFRERGLHVQFFPGIHGKTFGLRTALRGWSSNYMASGHVGLVLSHYMLWQTLAYLPHDEVLILEDDAYFEPDFAERFRRAYADLPDDWQFVFVGSFPIGGASMLRLSARIGVGRYPCGTHAYLLKRSILPLLLHTNHQARTHIDLQLIENTLPSLRCYTFMPSLVSQRGAGPGVDGADACWRSTTFAPDDDDDDGPNFAVAGETR